MLSVAIHKDIAEYQPKVIGKLTGRTLISITVALGLSVAVAVYMNLVLKIDPTDHLEFIYAVSLPCWCCGFWEASRAAIHRAICSPLATAPALR